MQDLRISLVQGETRMSFVEFVELGADGGSGAPSDAVLRDQRRD